MVQIITHKHSKAYNKALDIAHSLYSSGQIHVAVLFRRNTPISIGQNCKESTNAKAIYFRNKFKTGTKYPYIHAEIDAISKVWGKVYLDRRHTLVSVRLGKNGPLLAKPCNNCQIVLDAIGLNVIWTC